MTKLELITELQSNEFASQFDQFEKLIQEKSWISRARAIATEAKGNPMLRDFLFEENEIVFVLTNLSSFKRREGRLPAPLVQSKGAYDACTLVGLFADLYPKLNERDRKSLAGRLRGAFANPDDLRAIQFEWLVAVHLAKRGFHLDFSDETKAGTFDMLAVRDGVETEIECKCVTHKIGRQIQRHEALRTLSIFKKDFSSFAKNITGGLVVRVILPKKLPTAYKDQKQLCESIRAALLTHSTTNREVEIRVSDFVIDKSPFRKEGITKQEIRAFLEEKLSIKNKEALTIFTPGRRALVLSLESKGDDNIVGSIFDTVKDACDRQLSTNRAGIICVKLGEIEADELREIGQERDGKPTALRIATSKFMDSRRSSHLTALAFFSDGEFIQAPDGHTTQVGSSYFFRNTDSPFYNEVSASVLS